MRSEPARFIEHICNHPDDDAPRLIYADWLDEHNDPRGEFIRIQIALQRLPGNDPRRSILANREATLLARYHAHWCASLRGLAGGRAFRRGFIESVVIDARTFLHRADDLFRLAPVRHVQFLDVGSSLTRLMYTPHLTRLTGITIFAQHIDERLTRALVDSPHLDGLRSLSIGRNRVSDAGARRLAWSPCFRNLVELDLSDNTIGDTGARAIADSRNLSRLETLQLRRNELSRSGLATLCASPTLCALRHLELALNYIGTSQEQPRLESGAVALQSLNLSENGLTPEAMSILVTLPGLGTLRRLALERNQIGSAGAAVLADWSGAASLHTLALAGNCIGDDGARVLARSPYFHQLAELDLSDNPIHDPGAFEFLNSKTLPRLRRLGLPNLGLTPQMRRAVNARFLG